MKKIINILYVETSQNLILPVIEFINKRTSEFRVLLVDSLEKLNNQLNYCKYDLVITDLALPELSAFSVIRNVKRIQPNLPVVIVTNDHDIGNIVHMIRAGAYDYVKKNELSRLNDVLQMIERDRPSSQDLFINSENCYKSIVEQLPALISISDLKGNLRMVNRQFERLNDSPMDNYVGKNIFELFPQNISAEQWQEELDALRYKPMLTKEEKYVYPDKSTHIYSALKIPLKNKENKLIAVVVIATEITERKISENRIEHTSYDLELAQQIAKMGSWNWNIKTNIFHCSEAAYRIAGELPTPIKHKHEFFGELVHPDDRDYVQEKLDSLVKNMSNESFEYRIKRKDGSIRNLRIIPELEVNEQGHVARLFGVVQDYTRQKTEEETRNKLERQIQQIQKMEAIGHLTGGLAHDFNNILACILGYSELSSECLRRNDLIKLKEYLHEIYIAGIRGRDLVLQMLAFSKERFVEPKLLSLSPLVLDVLKMLKPTLPSSLLIETVITERLPKVLIDPVQLSQVLMNICINAKDAMSGCGRLTITMMNYTALKLKSCTSCHEGIKGKYVEIRITDTGEGILPSVLVRMFDPFYSTKEFGKGTGMGLAMVHGIMHKHQGHVLVNSVLGEGSQFSLLFPVSGLKEKAEENDIIDTATFN